MKRRRPLLYLIAFLAFADAAGAAYLWALWQPRHGPLSRVFKVEPMPISDASAGAPHRPGAKEGRH